MVTQNACHHSAISAADSPVREPNRTGLVKTKGCNPFPAPAQDRPYFTAKLSGPSWQRARAVAMQEWELTAAADTLLSSAPVLPGSPGGYANKVLVGGKYS